MQSVYKVIAPFRIKADTYALSSPGYFPLSNQSGNAGYPDDLVDRLSDPLWRQKVMMGVSATNNYKRVSTTFSSYPASVTAEKPSIDTGVIASIEWNTGHPTFDEDHDDVVLDQAVSRVKRRINNISQSYQALIPLVEIHELRGTIRQALNLATETVIALAEIKRTKGRSAWKHAQRTWLGFSFGVSPLMKDISDLSASINSFLNKKEHRDRVVGSASKVWSSSFDGGAFASAFLCYATSKAVASHQLSYRIIAGWVFQIQSGNDYTTAQHFGFKPEALIPAAWELTAFSWLVDYFTTVGPWLEDTFIGNSGSASYVVQNRRYRFSSYMDVWYEPVDSSVAVKSNHRGFSRCDRYVFERTPLAALPSRILRFKTLDETGLHGVSKLLNLIALTSGYPLAKRPWDWRADIADARTLFPNRAYTRARKRRRG